MLRDGQRSHGASVVVVAGPPALRAASPVLQLGGVCRAGCAADNNAPSRTLSQTHIPVGLLLLVEVAAGGRGVVVVVVGGDLTSAAQQAFVPCPPPTNSATVLCHKFFSHSRKGTRRPLLIASIKDSEA